MILTVFGMGGSAGLALGPPSRTVAPWYEQMQTRSKGTSETPEGEFLFCYNMF